jgi:hypothetical protein
MDPKDNNFCDEILLKLQASLHQCKSNKQVYQYNKMDFPININDCTNIQKYRQSLVATKTTLDIKNPNIHPFKQYSIEYNVVDRRLILDNVSPFSSTIC